jgi:heme/copper-type cytochrome/quinol oxidase subunit 2
MHPARRSAVRTVSLAVVLVGLLVVGALWGRSKGIAAALPSLEPVAMAQEATRATQEIHVVARKYSFSPRRIEVQENDLVKVTLETTDIPHSFVIDDDNYRIAKRATPGHPVVFEFRADKAGTFPFYCNLTTDSGCKNMRGELVVRARR